MLGDKIRKIRKGEDLTVAALAARVGVSESYISQLERGLVDPSVSLLRKLAFALNVSVASFFDEDGAEPIITRLEDREQETMQDGAVSFSWISPEAQDLLLEMAEVSIRAGSTLQAPANPHYVCLFLTQGSVHIQFGQTAAELQAGDSIFIPAHTPYTLTNCGTELTKGILCVSKGGQQI
ncbi:MAG: XRE family transcriptional regulator [Oscillospiraceae bacterium]|nr:XRE family transcriptional regulator [Oscillospiraceae bacterium]